MPFTRLRPGPEHRFPGLAALRARSAIAVGVGVLTGLSGCATAAKATPVTTTFPISEPTIDVRTHDVPTDLVASDRTDIRVTRWFDTKLATGVRMTWSLTGRTLDLRADCTGFANCDARFRVEIPSNVKVLRNGKATKLGAGGDS